ncbi:MAG: alpha-galactosidase, partial [Bdellovibrionales bacterium]|nr:alpha-galactosidase [Bdellovibrionales bacterium]
KEDDFLLLASVDESTGYTIYTWDLPAHELVIRKGIDNLVIDGTYKVMDLYVGQGKEEEVFGDWFKIQDLPRIQARPLAGWTSWYYHYTRISAEIVEANLKAFSSRQIPLDLIQIDDGWQPAVGDWLESNDKFPLGMKALVDSIHSHGYQAGLWLAPFIVERNSGIFKEHRDWLLTYDGEHLVKGGFNPLWGGVLNGYFYILDLRKTEVRKYLTTVMDQVLNQWGFDLVKLDFLYAIALIPLSNKSRGQIMSEAMDFLREICGEKLILGCGVPLGPSFGKVDYCRIGCDTHLNWELNIMRKAGLRERISTFTTLRDTIGRRQLNQHAFLNDPDVYILRNEKTKLSEEQKLTLFYVNQIFGSMVLTSDDITTYDEATLALYRLQFPVKFRKITRVEEAGLLKKVWFEMEDRKYFAAINLGDETVSVSLEEGLWYERTLGFISGAKEIQL